MKALEAYRVAADEVRQCLLAAKFRDGDAMSDDELRKLKDDVVIFYADKAELDLKRNTIVVCRTQPPTALDRADGGVSFRRLIAFIDVVTLRRMDDPLLMKALRKMEKAFLERKWGFEILGKVSAGNATDRIIINFQVERLAY